MRKLTTLVLLLLLTACASESTEDDKSKEVKASADVVAAEADNLPWEKYDTQEIYDVVNSGGEVFTLEDGPILVEVTLEKFEDGTIDEEWGHYLYGYSAELHAKHPEEKEYLRLLEESGINIRNENYKYAKERLELAKEHEGAK